jgi:hypothetical protein
MMSSGHSVPCHVRVVLTVSCARRVVVCVCVCVLELYACVLSISTKEGTALVTEQKAHTLLLGRYYYLLINQLINNSAFFFRVKYLREQLIDLFISFFNELPVVCQVFVYCDGDGKRGTRGTRS